MMKRMLQTMETQEQEVVVNPYQEYAEKYMYTPIDMQIYEQPEIKTPIEEDETTNVFPAFEFDVRQAVIASEILNRKY